MRAFAAVSITFAIAVCAAAPAYAQAQSHVQAAKKAEARGQWQKALEEWKAAYAADVNAEYLIGIGDAYSHLGNKEEARKNYDAYLADPLALPSNVQKVKARIAELSSAPGSLALPAAGGLALPGADASPPPALALGLPDAPAASESNGRKGSKKGKKGQELAALPLPGSDLPLPGSAPVAEKKSDPGLDLGALTLPGPPPATKKDGQKVASGSPGLELPALPLPGAPAKADAKKEKEQQLAAANPPPQRTAAKTPSATGQQVAVNTAKPPERRAAPEAAIAEPPHRGPSAEPSSGAARTVAYVAAGVAVVALGGGALAFTKAGSAHSELTGKVHDGATAQQLLGDEQRNKTLSFVGLAGGLVAAGVATALFVF